MVLYSIYIFNKQGTCIYYLDVQNRSKAEDPDQQKLLFGMLFGLKRFIQRMSPVTDDDGSFRHLTCSHYRLHFFQGPTGIRFVCMTDPKVESLQEELTKIYGIYVETCVRNPLYELGSKITCTLFEETLNAYLLKSIK